MHVYRQLFMYIVTFVNKYATKSNLNTSWIVNVCINLSINILITHKLCSLEFWSGRLEVGCTKNYHQFENNKYGIPKNSKNQNLNKCTIKENNGSDKAWKLSLYKLKRIIAYIGIRKVVFYIEYRYFEKVLKTLWSSTFSKSI